MAIEREMEMMRRSVLRWMLGMIVVVLAGCATAPPDYRVTPDGAKEFVLTMRAANFSPSYLSVNQGDRVRLVIYSYYQFAFFDFPQFNISRQIPHDAPEVVEFVATERGWFDFRGYGFYSYYAQLSLAGGLGGSGSEHPLYGRLYVR